MLTETDPSTEWRPVPVTRAEDEQGVEREARVGLTEGGLPRNLELISADLTDARTALGVAEDRASRHLVWAMLGLSPAALIPLVGLVVEGSLNLIGPLIALVFLVEGGRYLSAQREVKRLQEVCDRIRAERREALEEPSEEDGQ